MLGALNSLPIGLHGIVHRKTAQGQIYLSKGREFLGQLSDY
jgi:hypothetical protein